MLLELVDASAWPNIEPGLRRIAERCQLGPAPIAVTRTEVERGYAHLWVAPDFFCVIRPRHDDQQQYYLQILLAGGNLGPYMPQLEILRERYHAVYVEWRSPRPGWRKLAAKQGWQIIDTPGPDTIFRAVRAGGHHAHPTGQYKATAGIRLTLDAATTAGAYYQRKLHGL